MAEQEKTQDKEAAEQEQKREQKIMCFVSKQMVPLNETVEVEYAPRKKVRVLPRYIKYSDGAES